jgi:hypothetical protein
VSAPVQQTETRLMRHISGASSIKFWLKGTK